MSEKELRKKIVCRCANCDFHGAKDKCQRKKMTMDCGYLCKFFRNSTTMKCGIA